MNDMAVDRPEVAEVEPFQMDAKAGEPVSAGDERQYGMRVMPMAALVALAACGDGSDGAANSGDGATLLGAKGPASAGYPSARSDAEAARFLLQAQAYATTADIAAVRAGTFADWLSTQYGKAIGPTGWDWLNARGYATIDSTTRYFDNTYPGDYMIWNQLMTSPDALRKRCALALSEFFVVSLSGLDFAWRSHGIAAWWDLLVAHAFGNFRQLLEAVTLNPAMGYYLNTKGNLKENTATGRQPDENYAREVMQLFTIGLYQLNLDGTEKRGGQEGGRIETYSQSDVTNLARVFTGYDVDMSQNVNTYDAVLNRNIPNTTAARLPMVLNASRHSTLAATFLGANVPANTPGAAALKTALDTLFNHPNVGPFFGRQMIQRLVTSNPSRAYVARVGAAFNNNGSGVRGDLKAVWSAILLDEEARSPAGLTQSSFGRLREPMLRLVQWGRTFGITSALGSWKIGDLSNTASQLGQSPLRSPSVFNFFRPGYVPPSTALATSKAVAPEFQIVNESTVGGYLNYLQGVVRNGLYVNAPDQPNAGSNASNGYDITAAYTGELALGGRRHRAGQTAVPAVVRRPALRQHADADRECAQCHAGDRSQHRRRQTQPGRCRRADGDGLGRIPCAEIRTAPCT
jgi:uncharacterized protein (DUF1800 family)